MFILPSDSLWWLLQPHSTSSSRITHSRPRIIPAFHRRSIYRKDDRSDTLVKIYLSFFSLSRLVELAPKMNRRTFQSIVQPSDLDMVQRTVGRIKWKMPSLIARYLPWVHTIPLEQGVRWIPTWKALPNHFTLADLLFRLGQRKTGSNNIRSIFPTKKARKI